MTRRNSPRVRVLTYTWNAGKPDTSPGVLLRTRQGVLAHLSIAEARKTADAIHDAADAAEKQEVQRATKA